MQAGITQATFVTVIEHIVPSLRRIERLVRPRAVWVAADWVAIPVGLICLVLTIVITLPIPLGHVVPGVAITVLALGMIERDGIALAVGLTFAMLGLALVTFASAGVFDALSHWWRG
jgi:hypothetical protein